MNDRVDQVFLMSTGTMRRLARPRVWLAFGLPVMCLAATVMLGASDSAPIQNGGASSGQAQSAVSTVPKFDVVSIKPCPGLPPPGSGRRVAPSGAQTSPGYVRWGCVSLAELIDQAYAVPDSPLLNMNMMSLVPGMDGGKPDAPRRIRGGPSWVDSDRFTIEAKASGEAGIPSPFRVARYLPAAMNQALRAMLADRFQLKLRRATEQQPMYALTVAKGGLELTPAAPGDCVEMVTDATTGLRAKPPGSEDKLICGWRRQFGLGNAINEYSGQTLQDLARSLSNVMDRFVLDKTSVAGKFTFKLAYTADDHTPGGRPNVQHAAEMAQAMGIAVSPVPAAPSEGNAPNIFKALEALGLKLDPTKGPAEYFQIESVSKPRPNEALAIAIEPAQPAPSTSGPKVGAAQDTAAPAAQAASSVAPKFDVVSIKPCPGLDVVRPPGSGRSANPRAPQISPGYVHWDCVTLAELIDQAWAGGGNGPSGSGLLNILDRPREDSPKRVRGGPSWVHDERFTIEAKMSGDTTQLTGAARFVQVRDAMLPALRAMIEDRFQLRFRKATEQQSMYAMTVAKGGLEITQTAPQNCWRQPIGLGRGQVATPPPGFEGTPACGIEVHGQRDRGVSQMEITHANLKDFATWLSGQMDRYVLDKTGVPGRFSFKLEYIPDDSTPGVRAADRDPGFNVINGVRVPSPPPPPARTDAPNIFKALEALGLHLEPTKGPAEHLQIDSVQRPKPDLPTSLSRRSLGGGGR